MTDFILDIYIHKVNYLIDRVEKLEKLIRLRGHDPDCASLSFISKEGKPLAVLEDCDCWQKEVNDERYY